MNSHLSYLFTSAMNFKSIRNFFKTEEKKKKIPINQQTKFIETYSNNLINFVYKSVPIRTDDDKYKFNIYKHAKFNKNIYDIVCYDSQQIVAYFIQTKSYYKKIKTFDIFLNYNFNLPKSNILYPNLILHIYSFLPKQFNKTHKNGTFIGSIQTDWNYQNFILNVDNSNLCKNKIITNYLYNAKQYIYPNLTLEEHYTRPIKKTEISIRNNNQKTLAITNIRPEWDEELQIYTFQNWGRIRAKSTKNTQFVDKNNNIIAIFGRLEFEDEYVLDFKNMSLIQAISLAITCLNK